MTQHILCAVDLTHDADARALVAEAGRLAGYTDAALSVVTVVPDFGTSWVGSFFKEGTLEGAEEQARVALHRLVDEVLPGHPKVQCIVEVGGNAYQEILDAARKCDADLIIVGAHKPDLADRIIGPNASRIVRHAPVSVLVSRLNG